jgi:hypothetical protein
MFFDYRLISQEQFAELEAATSAESIKDLFAKYFGINYSDEKKQKIALDYHLYNYTFCKNSAFNGRKTSTFLSIMQTIWKHDMESTSAADTITSSYAFFEETLMKHCVERVPYNIKVFDEPDVGRILDFVVESYYRQFRLFNYIFGSIKRLQLKQVLPNEIEAPIAQQPLSSAMKLMPTA